MRSLILAQSLRAYGGLEATMDITYESFVNSRPFTFLIGAEKKTFFIHSELLKQCSASLATLVGGGMLESAESQAHLEDIEEDTFARFVQFAYTGDYVVPEPDILLSETDVVAEGPASDAPKEATPVTTPASQPSRAYRSYIPLSPDSLHRPRLVPTLRHERARSISPISNPFTLPTPGSQPATGTSPQAENLFGGPVQVKKESLFSIRSKGAQLWDEFRIKAQVKEAKAWLPRVNEDDCDDYTSVFLCHADLYVFSDRYGIKALQQLVLQKLHLTLSRFKLHPKRTGDIVDLLNYTYTNTMDYENAIDELRDLLTDYLVCHIEKIVKDKSFSRLLATKGSLAKDLMPKMMQRLDFIAW